jgi:hypothetical protein
MKNADTTAIDINKLVFKPNATVAIFVHWSITDKISSHDADLINSLAIEFDHVLVICNLNKLKSRKLYSDSIFHTNVKIGTRANEGYDFGGYQAGLQLLQSQQKSLSEVLLINNSIYKVHDSLTMLMKKVRTSKFEVTGITNSNEIAQHLQTYFIHIKEPALKLNVFWSWFKNLETYSDKNFTVESIEIPLSNFFQDLGLTLGAIWDYDEVLKLYFSNMSTGIIQDLRRELGWVFGAQRMILGISVNPTHYMWPHLMELGCPFLKKDLLRRQYLNTNIDKLLQNYVASPRARKLIKEDPNYDDIILPLGLSGTR